MSNLSRIRDSWTLLVFNLPRNVTEKDPFGHFHEASVVFDVFVPRNKVNGSSKGFAFVHYKTEWDAKQAISLLNSRSIGGKKISMHMAKNNKRRLGKAMVNKSRGNNKRGIVPVPPPFTNLTGSKHFQSIKDDVRADKEGSMHVVKVPASLSSSLKQEVRDSFVGTTARPDVTAIEIGE